jgi:metacaspase-1
VRNLAPFLNQRYGFSYDDMVILTDDQQDPTCQPTRVNIIRALKWLVADARPNDSFFLHFSGHGGQTEDLDGDEEDGLDETIYPVDFKQAGEIVDDVRSSFRSWSNYRNYMTLSSNLCLLDAA